jgi:hypothetical protein
VLREGLIAVVLAGCWTGSTPAPSDPARAASQVPIAVALDVSPAQVAMADR